MRLLLFLSLCLFLLHGFTSTPFNFTADEAVDLLIVADFRIIDSFYGKGHLTYDGLCTFLESTFSYVGDSLHVAYGYLKTENVPQDFSNHVPRYVPVFSFNDRVKAAELKTNCSAFKYAYSMQDVGYATLYQMAYAKTFLPELGDRAAPDVLMYVYMDANAKEHGLKSRTEQALKDGWDIFIGMQDYSNNNQLSVLGEAPGNLTTFSGSDAVIYKEHLNSVKRLLSQCPRSEYKSTLGPCHYIGHSADAEPLRCVLLNTTNATSPSKYCWKSVTEYVTCGNKEAACDEPCKKFFTYVETAPCNATCGEMGVVMKSRKNATDPFYSYCPNTYQFSCKGPRCNGTGDSEEATTESADSDDGKGILDSPIKQDKGLVVGLVTAFSLIVLVGVAVIAVYCSTQNGSKKKHHGGRKEVTSAKSSGRRSGGVQTSKRGRGASRGA